MRVRSTGALPILSYPILSYPIVEGIKLRQRRKSPPPCIRPSALTPHGGCGARSSSCKVCTDFGLLLGLFLFFSSTVHYPYAVSSRPAFCFRGAAAAAAAPPRPPLSLRAVLRVLVRCSPANILALSCTSTLAFSPMNTPSS